jgi:hypothetical protein
MRTVEKTTLYLPPDLLRALRDASDRTGRSQADLVREALRTYLADQPRPRPSSIGLGRDRSLAGRDAEVWLEERWGRVGRAG